MSGTKRLRTIDTIRGITILSMIGFHACWDLYSFGFIQAETLFGTKGYIWQQSICWSFILISGYCFSMGHHHLKRGLMSLAGGVLITAFTCLFMYEDRDIFGVLWMLGTSTLLMILLDKILPKKKMGAVMGLLISASLFILTRNINSGYLGFEGWNMVSLPSFLYKGHLMTFLGFMDPGFFSTDYFSLFPWFFLFTVGYFLNKIFKDTAFEERALTHGIRPLEIIGRHSFIIYMAHQPVVYGLIYLIYVLRK